MIPANRSRLVHTRNVQHGTGAVWSAGRLRFHAWGSNGEAIRTRKINTGSKGANLSERQQRVACGNEVGVAISTWFLLLVPVCMPR